MGNFPVVGLFVHRLLNVEVKELTYKKLLTNACMMLNGGTCVTELLQLFQLKVISTIMLRYQL
ncbi:hypothetical protein LBSP_00240 [Lentilactobacillus buchneri subsp. silagei]|nr:hypothetical protein Ltb232_14540 [Lentilactobacillus buchneri subsp. silagei]GED93464.1 hypothetical protein LBSP_00240 [Lentilactobacillus buchneri subsp. silagei]